MGGSQRRLRRYSVCRVCARQRRSSAANAFTGGRHAVSAVPLCTCARGSKLRPTRRSCVGPASRRVESGARRSWDAISGAWSSIRTCRSLRCVTGARSMSRPIPVTVPTRRHGPGIGRGGVFSRQHPRRPAAARRATDSFARASRPRALPADRRRYRVHGTQCWSREVGSKATPALTTATPSTVATTGCSFLVPVRRAARSVAGRTRRPPR